MELPVGSVVHFQSFLLDEGRFEVQPTGTVVAPGAFVELVITLAPGPVLHVVDGITGEELDGIDLFELGKGGSARVETSVALLAPPPGSNSVGTDLKSPVATPGGYGMSVIWAGRRGYAWNSLVVDYRSDADHCLMLFPLCEARILLDGLGRSQEFELSIVFDDGDANCKYPTRPEKASIVRRIAAEADPLVVVDLPPGAWTAELREAGSRPTRLPRSRRFMTETGESVTIVMESLRDMPDESIDCRIQLVVDGGAHNATSCTLRAVGVDAGGQGVFAGLIGERSGLGPITIDVGFEGVRPGKYVLTVMPAGWQQDVVVSASGVSPKFIHAPAPEDVELSFEYPSGWSRGRPRLVMYAPAGSGLYADTGPISSDDRVHLSTASRSLELLLYFEDADVPIEITVTQHDDGRPCVVSIPNSCVLKLQLRENDTRIFMRGSWWDRVEISDESGPATVELVARMVTGLGVFASGAEYRIAHPGRYTVKLPHMPGYGARIEGDVVLEPGRTGVLELSLSGSACSR